RTLGQAVNPVDLLKKADELAAAFFRKPPENYVLVSSLSVSALPSRNIDIGECTITGFRTRGNKWPLPQPLRDYGELSSFASHLRSTAYRAVKIATQGRSWHQAIEKALNALNLLRGLWSLIARTPWTIQVGGRQHRKPMGIIHTRHIH